MSRDFGKSDGNQGSGGGSGSPRGAPAPRIRVLPAKTVYPAEGGAVDLLVKVGVDLPAAELDRKPLALALVLDRSGSMAGAALEAAKAAACAAVEMLLPDDWVSVVTYDDQVRVVAPLAPAGTARAGLLAAVKGIASGGSTALYAGWAEGLSQVMSCPVTHASQRVVLLSDGMANVGPRDPSAIAADVGQAVSHGVTTTAMGFGRSYDEALLRGMADAGRGNYVFIEGEGQVVEAFQHELSGLSALRGTSVRLEPSVGVVLRSTAPGNRTEPGGGVALPDLVGGLERELLVTAEFAAGVEGASVTLAWDDLLTGGREALTCDLQMRAVPRTEYDATPTDPVVTAQAGLLRVAEMKLQASSALRSGRFGEAVELFGAAAQVVASLPPGEERDAEEKALSGLRDMADKMDALAPMASEKQARDRIRGTSDLKRLHQFRAERELFAQKTAHASGSSGVDSGPAAGSDGASLAHGRPVSDSGAGPAPVGAVTMRGPGGDVTVEVVLGDITEQAVDVVVNSTNRQLFGNTGVDGAIHRAGGTELTRAARELRGLQYGEAAFTPGFALPARYVVHTVATPWRDGASGELGVLARAYASAFELASRLGARTVAAPAIGTGTFGVPARSAAEVAARVTAQAIAAGVSFSVLRFVMLHRAVAEEFVTALGAAATASGRPEAAAAALN